MFQVGRVLMGAGLLIVGGGLLWAMRVEAREPDFNPLGVELAAVAVGFVLFTVGRWCAAKVNEQD